MAVLDLLLGRPLASDQARGEQIGSWVGILVFGLDALSSAAYGPEAALTVLIPLGAAGIAHQRHWYHHILHNKRAAVLKGLLLLKGNQRIIVINVPWYLEF
jgi:hypothetical protein